MKSKTKNTLTVIGAGHAGSALAIAFHRAGWSVQAVVDIDLKKARRVAGLCRAESASSDIAAVEESGVFLLCVPDEAISHVASDLASRSRVSRGRAVHTSGRLSSEALHPLSRKGWKTASMHPCCSFARYEATPLKNVAFAIEGDEDILESLRRTVTELGGIPFTIGTDEKTAYHTACVLASNGLVALFGLIEKMGFEAGSPVYQALLTLAAGTLENLETGAAGALTGPVARGDAETVAEHIKILKPIANASEAYRALSLEMLRLAGNLSPGTRNTLRDLLDSVKENEE